MSRQHLVRVGAMGHVGRYVSSDATVFPRHARVIVRTRRGVEIGEILTAPEATGDEGQPDGAILRGMTTDDFLLEARLEKNRHRAFEAVARSYFVRREIHLDFRFRFWRWLGR